MTHNHTSIKNFLVAVVLLVIFGSGDAARKVATVPVTLSPSLCEEFRALQELIPQDTLSAIVSKHYNSDVKFRVAMEFLNSTEFTEIARDIEQSDVYKRIFMQFSENGVNLCSLKDILDCLILPASISSNSQRISAHGSKRMARSLQTFAMEVANAIPRSDFRSLLELNLAKNPQFSAFYNVIANSTFQRQLLLDVKSTELSSSMKVLKSNNIDVPRLLQLAFKLLAWGPDIV